jgi:hypothetical protein
VVLTPTETEPQHHRMRTFHVDVRLIDLEVNDFVYVECQCGRNNLLTRGLLKQLGMKPEEKLRGLDRRMHCRRCGQLVKVTVSIRRAR